MKTIEKVAIEIEKAKEKYGPFNSTHEIYGVLAEELDEFFDEVKYKPSELTDLEYQQGAIRDKKYRMMLELTQIAAISLRAISEIENNEIKWI